MSLKRCTSFCIINICKNFQQYNEIIKVSKCKYSLSVSVHFQNIHSRILRVTRGLYSCRAEICPPHVLFSSLERNSLVECVRNDLKDYHRKVQKRFLLNWIIRNCFRNDFVFHKRISESKLISYKKCKFSLRSSTFWG